MEVAVVGREDDDRVVEEAAAFEGHQDPADPLVDRGQAAHLVAHDLGGAAAPAAQTAP